MPLSLRIISSPNGEPISDWTKNFPEEGGSIGRSFGTTMQLSDATREVSGTHAVINRGSRGYQIMDMSTNGLFINGSNQPLGKNNQSALNDGDVIDLGQYRLMVSCFVPAQATAKKGLETANSPLGSWEDDPFGSDIPPMSTQPEAPAQVREPELSFSALSDSVEQDPFLEIEAEKESTDEVRNISLLSNDGFDDDPFAEDSSDSLTPITFDAPIAPHTGNSSPNIHPAMDPQQLLSMQAKQQELMIQAVEMAFGRLMEEMAPAHLEDMFNDIAQPGFFSRKPDYWSMYKRYFQRQQDNQDWQLKFKAYFSESLRIKQSLGEK